MYMVAKVIMDHTSDVALILKSDYQISMMIIVTM